MDKKELYLISSNNETRTIAVGQQFPFQKIFIWDDKKNELTMEQAHITFPVLSLTKIIFSIHFQNSILTFGDSWERCKQVMPFYMNFCMCFYYTLLHAFIKL